MTVAAVPKCPYCGSLETVWMAKAKKWQCNFCEDRFNTPDTVLAFECTDDLSRLIDALPSPIALTVKEFQLETNPVVKLWAMSDSVEMLLKLLAFIGIGELHQQQRQLPAQLRKKLRSSISTPTLGRWLRMAEDVANTLATDSIVPEMRPLMLNALSPLLDGSPPEQARTPRTSLLSLRNHLAHGGGLRQAQALELLEHWTPKFEALLRQLEWLTELELLACYDDAIVRLIGPNPHGLRVEQQYGLAVREAFVANDSVVVVRGERIIPIWPLMLYGNPLRVGRADRAGDSAVQQVYMRQGAVELQYTPLGESDGFQSVSDSTAVDWFREVFRLDEAAAREKTEKFSVADFDDELGKLAKDVIGRSSERARLREALDIGLERPNGDVLWVSGAAGMGKSFLIADLAAHLAAHPKENTHVLAYRFRAGDKRCNRDSFLKFFIERIDSKLADSITPDKGLPQTESYLANLLSNCGEQRFILILDGLDEIAEYDRKFVIDIPLRLRQPGVVWICAGKPDLGLSETFKRLGAQDVFPAGLPPMQEGDIREILLERSGKLRNRLLRSDREQAGVITNPFIEKVTRLSGGLPLYVKYVIDDIHAGRYRAFDVGEDLPPGLQAYHEALLGRMRVGTLQQIMTPLAALLCLAREPMSIGILTHLLEMWRLVPAGDRGMALVSQALSATAAMVRYVSTRDGDGGYLIYHHSMSQHMTESEQSRDAVETASIFICDLAQEMIDGASAQYLFRQGVAHLLAHDGSVDRAVGLLTNFEYLLRRLRSLPDPSGVEGIGADWRAVMAMQPDLDEDTLIWEAFWREHEHLLRRGNDAWPAYKILLQCAVEYSEDSPVTRSAEDWLSTGMCDWTWLRGQARSKAASRAYCLRVLEGHSAPIGGSALLPNGRALTWSDDGSLRVWCLASGKSLVTIDGHERAIHGALILPGERILSWSWHEPELRLWNSQGGEALGSLSGHDAGIVGALLMPSGNILTFSEDSTLRLWSKDDYSELHLLEGHLAPVRGALGLAGGRVLSWSDDKSLRIWDEASGSTLAVLEEHHSGVLGAIALSNGRIVSWGQEDDESAAVLWTESGELFGRLSGDRKTRTRSKRKITGHTAWVTGALELASGDILTWSDDGAMCIWNSESGVLRTRLEVNDGLLLGALEIDTNIVAAWTFDGRISVWNVLTGERLANLDGHTEPVNGVLSLGEQRLLSWSEDRTLRIWNRNSGEALATLEGHGGDVTSARVVSGEIIISQSNDGSMRIWSQEIDCASSDAQIRFDRIDGFECLLDGRVLAWGYRGQRRPSANVNEREGPNGRIGIMDTLSGAPLRFMRGDMESVTGAKLLEDGRILSWGSKHPETTPDSLPTPFGCLCLWDESSGECLDVIKVNSSPVEGILLLADGRILSWSRPDFRTRILLRADLSSPIGKMMLDAGTTAAFGLSVWDERAGESPLTLKGHTAQIRGAVELASGDVLSWSEDCSLRIWDTKVGVCRLVLEGHTKPVIGGLLMADGSLLSWSEDNTLRIWDASNGSELITLTGHTGPVNGAIALSAGRVLSWSEDTTLRIWDSETGALLTSLQGHTSPVRGARLLSDGCVVSWSEDSQPSLWRLESEAHNSEIVDRLELAQDSGCPIVSRSLATFRPRFGVAVVTAEKTGSVLWAASSEPRGVLLRADGTVIVALSSGQLLPLRVFRGNSRIGVRELERGNDP